MTPEEYRKKPLGTLPFCAWLEPDATEADKAFFSSQFTHEAFSFKKWRPCIVVAHSSRGANVTVRFENGREQSLPAVHVREMK